VSTIQKTVQDLSALIPEAKCSFAHGQMSERELEHVMADFYHQRFNVLVCTTIIETGIDIPTANTIIIEHADRFGLAQLHQLRGRVGRSHHQAYAYLLAPPPKVMTADAEKRLEAIVQAEELGAGFILATNDLEIRGAGELLGEDQSGQIASVGFTLYMEFLEKAVDALKSGKTPNFSKPLFATTEIDLHVSALIPEDYLPDVHSRLTLYKRIANAKDSEALKDLQVEMIDRFGLLPDPTKNLFRVTDLKLKAFKLGIIKIIAGKEGGYIEFDDNPAIEPFKLIQLIQKEPRLYKLQGAKRLNFYGLSTTVDERFSIIMTLLKKLDN
jgi:transcription-repair coupling factor (superfamily II helicase)